MPGEAKEVVVGVTVKTAGRKATVQFKSGMTVGQAMRGANVKKEWRDKIFMNGVRVEESVSVKDGDTVVVAPKVANG